MSALILTSDSLASPAVAGTIEYTSPALFGTPIGTQRGIVPTQMFYRLDSPITGTQALTAQNIFNVGCTLSSSTVYVFDILVAMGKSAGTTSHQVNLGFGGTATLNYIRYLSTAQFSQTSYVSPNTNLGIWVQSATAIAPAAASASANQYFIFSLKGTVSVNAGGTFIPQYTLSAAPGGAYTVDISSYIRIYPLSASGSNTNVGTWA